MNVEDTYLDMARAYEAQANYERALVWYKKIRDNADVFEIIGEYLYLGRGCGQDKKEAKKYFELAAALGNTDAECNLALCEDSPERKLEHYRKAAAAGSAYAMNMVGIVLEDADLQRADESTEWFRKAADAGSDLGCYNYAVNCEDPAVRMRYLEKAANMNCIVAMEKYAEYLSLGQYCKKDPAKADELRKKIRSLQFNQANA